MALRVKLSNDPEEKTFDDFTLLLGNGDLQTTDDADYVEVLEEMCNKIKPNSVEHPEAEKDSMKNLAAHVYPDLVKNSNKCGS